MKPTILFLFVLLYSIFSSPLSNPAAAFEQQITAHLRGTPPINVMLDAKPAVEVYYLHLKKDLASSSISSLTDSSVLTIHDGYSIIMLPLKEYFIYIFEVHSNGTIRQRFPSPKGETTLPRLHNPVEPERRYDIPAKGELIDVGNPPSLQEIHLIVSSTRQQKLLDKYAQMRSEEKDDDNFEAEQRRASLLRMLRKSANSDVHPKVDGAWIRDRKVVSPVTRREFGKWLNSGSTPWNAKGGGKPSTATLFQIFRPGTTTLTPESLAIFQVYGEELQKRQNVAVEIRVYTDEPGTPEENKRLSNQQADVLKKYLYQQSPRLQPGQITVTGFGQSNPLMSNPTGREQRINNRIEIIRRK